MVWICRLSQADGVSSKIPKIIWQDAGFYELCRNELVLYVEGIRVYVDICTYLLPYSLILIILPLQSIRKRDYRDQKERYLKCILQARI